MSHQELDGRPAGSTAREAFVASADRLSRYQPSAPSLPPAVSFVPRRGRPCPEPVFDGAAPARTPHDPLSTAASDVASGRRTARSLVESCAREIERRDSELVAFAELRIDEALVAADLSDRRVAEGAPIGPLHGIPLSVKDVIDVAGMTTRCGSLAYSERPVSDAYGVARLREAGAIIIGKATTHEFALGVTSPQSRNPHDVDRIPGGSSGGSAISVATGMSLGSLGTDTRASIRVPTALCGLVGLKPTFGTVATDGVVPLSWTMDHVAPIANTVRDAALMLDVLTTAGGQLVRWADAAVSGWRVGVPAAAFDGCEPDVATAVRRAIDVLRHAGCTIVDVDRPNAEDFEDANAAGLFVSRCEAATYHRGIDGDLGRYWPEVAGQLHEARRVSALDYLDAQRLRADLGAAMLRPFDDIDLLVMPTVPVVAPPAADFARYLMVLSRNAIPWSFLGFPAMSVPCGRDRAGLPIGMQVVGMPGHDGPVVALGATFERASRA